MRTSSERFVEQGRAVPPSPVSMSMESGATRASLRLAPDMTMYSVLWTSGLGVVPKVARTLECLTVERLIVGVNRGGGIICA